MDGLVRLLVLVVIKCVSKFSLLAGGGYILLLLFILFFTIVAGFGIYILVCVLGI